MESKKRYKLYKSGKKWCCMALTTIATAVGMITTQQHIQADTTTNNDPQQVVVNQNQTYDTNVQSSNTIDNNQNLTDETKTFNESNKDNSTSVNYSDANENNYSETNTENDISTNAQTIKNGWYDENGQKIYYQNGKTQSGQDYVYVQSMDNSNTKNWYMIKDGVALSGLQKWFGTYYYFNPVTYLKVTDAEVPVKWDNGDVTNYRFDNTGAIYTGLYHGGNDLYYYDPSTYVTVKNDYRVAEDGQGYMFGTDGKAVSGLQKWYGTYYYFDPTNYQMVKNQYLPVHWSNGDTTWYRFGNTGSIYTGLYRSGNDVYYFDPSTYVTVKNDFRIAEDGQGYMFGADGKAISGLQKWYGTYYYFDPSTYQMVKNDYVPVHWSNGDTTWYMFGSTGAIVTGLYKWYGTYYYFDPSTYVKDTNMDIDVKGIKYHLNETGAASFINTSASKADKALTVLGTPYVWGGNTPAGFDCSGLVQWAFGLGSNYRTTYQQTNLGTHKRDVYNAPKGSLVFFGNDSSPYHVGISLGNGSFVHAPEPGDRVKITKMAYYTPSFYIVMN
ncbi:C40 family peptidase [Lactobacillus coleohominis]|nr:NlpC/P60 family protein [Limosilactobacillus coleohominis]MBM6955326.1 C40 family peptidase [Limosilactobacillus coleohominis]